MVNITDSDYRTISVRLPRQEFIKFDKLCKDTHSAKLRELINKEIKSNSKSNFLSGINKITYNKVNNSFSWLVKLDSGQETEILNNLSLEFLKNLQQDIQEAIKERNQWVHQTKDDSVGIPKDLVEGEK
ncbi:MAG: hypothetical protein Q8P57_03820 [Candidatus Pacearchaeota archaeon]|nr:hypothetical protein [Candidatus Pacearchaeota archaeon]